MTVDQVLLAIIVLNCVGAGILMVTAWINGDKFLRDLATGVLISVACPVVLLMVQP